MTALDDAIKYIDGKMVEVSNRMIYFTQQMAELEAKIETVSREVLHAHEIIVEVVFPKIGIAGDEK